MSPRLKNPSNCFVITGNKFPLCHGRFPSVWTDLGVPLSSSFFFLFRFSIAIMAAGGYVATKWEVNLWLADQQNAFMKGFSQQCFATSDRAGLSPIDDKPMTRPNGPPRALCFNGNGRKFTFIPILGKGLSNRVRELQPNAFDNKHRTNQNSYKD